MNSGALARDAEARARRLEEEIAGILGRRINLKSSVQVKQALHECGVPVSDTKAETLATCRHREALVATLLEYREAEKRSGSYSTSFTPHPSTGRFHADYRQIGAITGRMACSGPNLQQVPSDPAYRRCFCAPAGRVLVKADHSQIEMRIAAAVSNDGAMLEAIANGMDLHALTAAALFQKQASAVTAEERAVGKLVNFGSLFVQGIRGLMKAAAQHGRALSEAEARHYQTRFARAWPEFARWQRRQMEGRGRETRTAAGRVRYLDAQSPATVRVNTPIQGTAADVFKAGLAQIAETRAVHPNVDLVLAIRDEVVMECDVDDADDVASWVTDCLTAGVRRYLPSVPVQVDVSVSSSWGGHDAAHERVAHPADASENASRVAESESSSEEPGGAND